MPKYQILLITTQPDPDTGERRCAQVADLDGDFATIVSTLKQSVSGLATVTPTRGKPVKVLWVERSLGHGEAPNPPQVGQVFESLRAMSAHTGLNFNSLNQAMTNFKARGYSGAVHSGVAYAFVSRAESNPGDLPAIQRQPPGYEEKCTIVRACSVIHAKQPQSLSFGENRAVDLEQDVRV